jgi:hypothetical protein
LGFVAAAMNPFWFRRSLASDCDASATIHAAVRSSRDRCATNIHFLRLIIAD